MIGVCILGATGSVGVSTLDVLARHPDEYRVVALSARRNVERLLQQCLQWQPRLAVMTDPAAAEELRQRLREAGSRIEVCSGEQALLTAATLDESDYVMAAIVGAAGLQPTLAAAQAGKRVLLANKEALVMAGDLFMQAVAEAGAELLPIDSEHNALFQCLPSTFTQATGRAGDSTVDPRLIGSLRHAGVTRLLLTASGGPFLHTPPVQLAAVTPAQACAHPNWEMGRKISVDSASMMNKGLEVIEACWLFGAELNQVDVVIHPQSIVHSLVQYSDGSVLAQLGNPDMRTPIAHALAWPQRMTAGVSALDLCAVGRLDFLPPDEQRFPCLRLARQAMQAGGVGPALLNAANEVAVDAFLHERLRFDQIPHLIEEVLNALPVQAVESLEQVLDADSRARCLAEQLISTRRI